MCSSGSSAAVHPLRQLLVLAARCYHAADGLERHRAVLVDVPEAVRAVHADMTHHISVGDHSASLVACPAYTAATQWRLHIG